MKSFFLLLLSLVPASLSKAQNMTAYTDYRNYFFGFDDGTLTQLDHLPPKAFRVGGNSIAFISNANNFKVFQKGFTYDVTEGAFVKSFNANATLVAYLQSNQLNIFEKGNPKTLSTWVTGFAMDDSILVYFDDIARSFKAYYDGSSYFLDDLLAGGTSVKNYRLGDNLVAYVNHAYLMKVFYQGAVYDLQNTNDENIMYVAGRDVVGFVDQLNNTLNVFYQGNIYELEKSPPQSMKAGDGLLAYVDYDGNFKRFAAGKTRTISSFAPDNYYVKDSMIVYTDNNQNFSVFYNGKSYMLENYIPKDFKLEYNMVAYIDQQNRLKLFKQGETRIISYDLINSFELNRNVLTYNILNNDTRIYYKGRNY